MNKSELLSRAAAASMFRTEADTAVSAMFSAIADALAAGETVAIAGFGTFTMRQRSARNGRNPRTGEAIDASRDRAAARHSGRITDSRHVHARVRRGCSAAASDPLALSSGRPADPPTRRPADPPSNRQSAERHPGAHQAAGVPRGVELDIIEIFFAEIIIDIQISTINEFRPKVRNL